MFDRHDSLPLARPGPRPAQAVATVLTMGILYPCRHGRSERDCVVCANEKVAEAVRDQTAALKEQADETERKARKERAAVERRARRERQRADPGRGGRRSSPEVAQDGGPRGPQEGRAHDDQLQQLHAIRQQSLAGEERRQAEADAELSVERTRWRAAYKQSTGIFDEDLVEAAWLDHRATQQRHAELEAGVDRIVDSVTVARVATQQVTGLATGSPGLPLYTPEPAAPDDLRVQQIQDELDRLPRLSFRRGKLQDEFKQAQQHYRSAQLDAARLQAASICWEAASWALQTLRSSWPSAYLDWDQRMDQQAVALVECAPAVPHEISPGELATRGLNYETEVRPVMRLLKAVDDVIARAAAADKLAQAEDTPGGT